MKVTIEGSVTPSTYLGRGKRMTVERDSFVDKLIRRGYVNVVEERVPVTQEIHQRAHGQREVTRMERKITAPPKRSASKADWQTFLDQLGVAYPKTHTKNDLIARWEASVGQQAIPDEYVSDGE